MAEGTIAIAPTGGTFLHTNSYLVGGTTVHDEVTIPGPYPYATYSVQVTASAATGSDHLLCLNAGTTLKVRVHYIYIRQVVSATSAAAWTFNLLRTTTAAPTGGTAITPAPFDTSDAAAGAAGRSLPTVKGTESTVIAVPTLLARQAIATTGAQADPWWEWRSGLSGGHGKPIIIPAGVANGLVVKTNTASAATTFHVYMEFTETAF